MLDQTFGWTDVEFLEAKCSTAPNSDRKESPPELPFWPRHLNQEDLAAGHAQTLLAGIQSQEPKKQFN